LFAPISFERWVEGIHELIVRQLRVILCKLSRGSVARLVAEHRDLFDRMIAAQALALDVGVISPDAQLDQFGVRRMW